MSIFQEKLPTKLKLQAAVIGLVIVAVIGYIIFDVATKGPLTSLLANKEQVIATVQKFGVFAPLLYIFLQIMQTVAAPIPGQVVGTVGGFLFGWWGILWTTIGSAIGFFIVFSLSRRFGRSLVEKIIKKEHLDKFDFVAGKHAPLILFLIFLIPGFPDDVVCYVAGLTDVPIKTLMWMIIIGRFPAVITTNIFGSTLGESNSTPLVVIALLTALVLGLVFIYRERITKYFKKLTTKQ